MGEENDENVEVGDEAEKNETCYGQQLLLLPLRLLRRIGCCCYQRGRTLMMTCACSVVYGGVYLLKSFLFLRHRHKVQQYELLSARR